MRASGGVGEGRAGLASVLSRIKLPAVAIPGRIVAVVAAVLLVLVVGGVVVTNSPIFSVTEVVVNGSEHVTQDTVERLVDVPEGSTLFNYDASAIEASLKQNPWVESVQIEHTFPHTITITPVEYKVAAIAYITSSDVAWAIDASGTWIAPISLSVAVDAEGNVVSGTAGTQASLQQGSDGSEDASASSDGAGGDAASSDSTGGDASSSGDGADTSGASSDSDAAGDAEGGSSADSDTAPADGGSGSDAASADNASSSDGSAADGTQTLTGINAALALARQDGAVLFTDIASDVEPSEGSKVSSDVITAGLEYVSGFSSDFLAQVDYLSLESVDAISVFLSNGIEVALGEPTDVSLKERVVTGLLGQVQGITYIDVRSPESPTYRSAPSA
ncbi:FtsQ-type POTRA domain-containing protein [Enorma massiliensis]|uniref:cell division protein FtsQ/DivIB n=1 Tax=Enorma massiliensis TaxID=1472761 RepID=UPI003A95C9E0